MKVLCSGHSHLVWLGSSLHALVLFSFFELVKEKRGGREGEGKDEWFIELITSNASK